MDYKNPLKMIDPLTGMEMTPQPPMPSNQMGTAQPVFNQNASNAASMMYGTPLERQMSMPQPPMFMKDIPKGDKGAGLRALDDSVVEQMGYDSATKIVSPLNQEGPGDKMLKKLTDKSKVTTAYNSSYTGNPNVSTRVYNAATGLTVDQDPTYNYEKRNTYNANAISEYGSLEKSRKALQDKVNKYMEKNK